MSDNAIWQHPKLVPTIVRFCLLLPMSHGVSVQGAEEVDPTVNSATTFLTSCVATYQYMTDLATGSGSAQQAAQFSNLSDQYRYIATIYAAILFPKESVQYADQIVTARVNGRLTLWAGEVSQNGEDAISSTISSNMSDCAELNNSDFEEVRRFSEFATAKAKVDASEFGL